MYYRHMLIPWVRNLGEQYIGGGWVLIYVLVYQTTSHFAMLRNQCCSTFQLILTLTLLITNWCVVYRRSELVYAMDNLQQMLVYGQCTFYEVQYKPKFVDKLIS